MRLNILKSWCPAQVPSSTEASSLAPQTWEGEEASSEIPCRAYSWSQGLSPAPTRDNAGPMHVSTRAWTRPVPFLCQ